MEVPNKYLFNEWMEMRSQRADWKLDQFLQASIFTSCKGRDWRSKKVSLLLNISFKIFIQQTFNAANVLTYLRLALCVNLLIKLSRTYLYLDHINLKSSLCVINTNQGGLSWLSSGGNVDPRYRRHTHSPQAESHPPPCFIRRGPLLLPRSSDELLVPS